MYDEPKLFVREQALCFHHTFKAVKRLLPGIGSLKPDDEYAQRLILEISQRWLISTDNYRRNPRSFY